jgi:hypothetical protein
VSKRRQKLQTFSKQNTDTQKSTNILLYMKLHLYQITQISEIVTSHNIFKMFPLYLGHLSKKWNHNTVLFLSLQRLPRWPSEVMCKSSFALLLLKSDINHSGSNGGKGQCTIMWPGVQYFLHGIRHPTVFLGLIKSHSVYMLVIRCKWAPVHLCYTELFGTGITWFLYHVECALK